jgi:F-type H+-transporting ATPase subunit c
MKKTLIAMGAGLFSATAMAQEAVGAVAGVGDKGYYALGAAIVLGLAAFGGTTGQGKVGAAAMEGIARNPQAAKALNTPMILTLALIESLVVLSFLIAFFIQGKF